MENKKQVTAITDREVNFAQWYTDVVQKAGLAGYSPVRGCMYVHPYGTAVWENIRANLDTMFKATGHENVMLPMFIPESLLQKEKDHVEGFAPEVAWVTHGGKEKLAERMCIRPTSEVLFCDYYKGIIQSWRDLPKLYNQWANVCRWEKTTRPFLRTMEFYWQEGHTIHETAECAKAETLRMLDLYCDFAENYLAIPVIKGQKSEKEKFAGAVATYTFEALMYDGQALQCGTSHYFGDGFARAFDIKFAGRDGKLQIPHQTSWGVTTRLIGGIIMVHGDNNGLVLPPAVAPTQVIVVPIAIHKEGVLNAAQKLTEQLKSIALTGHSSLVASQLRASLDASDNTPGWKFAEYEMKGVPLRIEYGPRDIEAGTCVVVRRDNGEKSIVAVADLAQRIPQLLNEIHQNMFSKAKTRRDSMTYVVKDMKELAVLAKTKPGFYKSMWCGDQACEIAIKEQFSLTNRCTPFDQENLGDKCVVCGKPSKKMTVWGRCY
jgi:prolyl-tRNA synthetase